MSKAIAENRKARFDYDILETLEAGIVLIGEEVKAIRAGKVNLAGSYGKILAIGGKPEVWLVGANIATAEGDPSRSRKLLLNRREVDNLIGRAQEKGLTILPLKMYLKRGYIKLELGIGRGRKKYDKRERIKEREVSKELRQKRMS
ncbi:MAG: SsrA-binding protein SmpB [bacterium]|nr:SsrA-binding protein SmpB [bacterium]